MRDIVQGKFMLYVATNFDIYLYVRNA